MIWRNVSIFLAVALLASPLALAQNTTCYSPDGSMIEDAFPCGDPATGHQSCCPKDGYCMQQGLCLDDNISRGTCTDPTWQSDACSPWCQNVYGNNYCGIILFRDAPERLFCCSPYHNAAEDETCLGLDGNNGTGFPFPGTGTTGLNITGFANTSYTNLMPWLTIASSSPDGAASSNGTLCAAPVAAEPDHSGRDIGIGVGVALGVCFLVALGFAFWQMRRASKLQKELNQKINDVSISQQNSGGWYANQQTYAQTTGYKPAPQHEMDAIDQYHELPDQNVHK